MKGLKKYAGCALLAFMAMAASSCIKDGSLPASGQEKKFDGTATVTLHVGESRAPSTAPAEDNEGIKTLRVLVADEAGIVEFNYKGKAVASTGAVREQTVTFLGMTAGKKTFYVIANEESLGLGEAVFPRQGGTIPEDFMDKIVGDALRSHFPKMRSEIGETGLPITGYGTVTVTPETKDVEIDTYHAVAKVSLSFVNNTGTNIPVRSMTLGQFMADQMYMFRHEPMSVPTDTEYEGDEKSWIEGNRPTIRPGNYEDVPSNKDLLTFYVYETDADPSNYTVSLDTKVTGVSISEAKQFVDGKQLIRNNWVQVTATINPNSVEMVVSLDWRVTDWTGVTVDVPEFN